MNCEEFEILGLHSQRDGSVGDDGRERALQHARVCGRCAALGASWAAAQAELAALAESSRIIARACPRGDARTATVSAQAPAQARAQIFAACDLGAGSGRCDRMHIRRMGLGINGAKVRLA